MKNYIDGFVFPISKIHLNQYKLVAEKIAEIWKKYGTTAYFEFIGNAVYLEGTKSFLETTGVKENEEIIFGWIVFPSKEIRDFAHNKVSKDDRITELVNELLHPEKLIFDATRMICGGYKPLIQLTK